MFLFSNLADQVLAVLSEMGTDTENFVRHVVHGPNGEITLSLFDPDWIPDMVSTYKYLTIQVLTTLS